MTATGDLKGFWQENGYWIIQDMLSPAEVASLRQSADALEAHAQGMTEGTDRFIMKAFDTGGGKRVQQIAEPHELGGEWMALARDARILNVVEQLIGPNIQLYYSMFMMKPPHEGFTAPWHQDLSFFNHKEADILACQVYLDDATLENGCLRIVPGSHQTGLFNHYKGSHFTGIVQGDTSAFDAQEVVLPVKAGSAVLWHSLTLHSSHANTSDRPRRAIVFEYKSPAARLMGGAFNARLEVHTVGLMVRGRDPGGDLLSAL